MEELWSYIHAKVYDEMEWQCKALGIPYEKEKSLKWQLSKGRTYGTEAEQYGA